jgi:hypothetical protein
MAYSRVGLASEKAAFTVVLTKRQHGLSNPVVPIGLQQELHRVLERRPDDPLDVEDFVRLVSKSAQRREATCQNAGLRINQGAVEIEKNRAKRGHGFSIGAAFRWNKAMIDLYGRSNRQRHRIIFKQPVVALANPLRLPLARDVVGGAFRIGQCGIVKPLRVFG